MFGWLDAFFGTAGEFVQHAPYKDCASWCNGEGERRCRAPGCRSGYEVERNDQELAAMEMDE